MKAWVKTLIGAACVLTMLLNLVPEGKFAKYVRFYAGLLFLLLAMEPVLNLLDGEGEFQRFLDLEFLKEDYYDLQTAAEGASELKDSRIREAFQQELRRQVEETVAACGIPGAQVEVAFDREGYTMTRVSIRIPAGEWPGQAMERIREELSGVYGLEDRNISITGEGGRAM